MMYRKTLYANYAKWKAQNETTLSGPKRQLESLFPMQMFPELSFFKRASRKAKILELGCGDASFLGQLHRLGFSDCTGVDLSKPPAQLPISFVESDIVDYLRKSSETYDFICLFDVLEHFNKNEIVELLNLVRARLAPQGKLIVRVPNFSSAVGRFNQVGDFTHETAFNEESLAQVLSAIGFAKLQIFGSERWFKLVVDPRRWPGAVLFGIYALIYPLVRKAFGGAKILTANLIAVVEN